MIIPLFFLETGSAGSVLFSQTVCCGGDTVVVILWCTLKVKIKPVLSQSQVCA